MKRLLVLLPLLLASLNASYSAPTNGIVKASVANLRARPSPNADIITRLRQGEVVHILGAAPDTDARNTNATRWTKVALPPLVPVWISAALVDSKSNTVTNDVVNLRIGPGKNFAAVGILKRGAKFNPIHTEGAWIQIDPPDDAAGYVATDLLGPTTQPVRPPIVAAAKPGAKPASKPLAKTSSPTSSSTATRTNTPSAATAPKAPSASASPKLLPAAPTNAGRLPTTEKTDAKNLPPEPTTAFSPPPRRPARVEPPITTTDSPLNPAPIPDTSSPPPSAATAPPPPAELPIVATNIVTEYQKIKRIVNREGIVGLSRSPLAPSYLELRSLRRNEGLLNFLYTENKEINLNRFKGKNVAVRGEEWIDPRWPKTPMLRVDLIEEVFN